MNTKQITYKTIMSMTDKEITKRCNKVLDAIAGISVGDQLTIAANVLYAVAIGCAKECPTQKQSLIVGLDNTHRWIVDSVNKASAKAGKEA